MYSNMCVKIALCVALFVCMDCHVLKPKQVPLPPEGLTIEVAVKGRGGKHHPISTMKIEIDEVHKKVIMSSFEDEGPPEDIVPMIGTRHGIVVGTCPVGYSRRGGFCFPDDY